MMKNPGRKIILLCAVALLALCATPVMAVDFLMGATASNVDKMKIPNDIIYGGYVSVIGKM